MHLKQNENPEWPFNFNKKDFAGASKQKAEIVIFFEIPFKTIPSFNKNFTSFKNSEIYSLLSRGLEYL